MKKRIILYTFSGLCNRMRPLASCMELAKLTNRELVLYWEPQPECNIGFEKLFSNKIKKITTEEILLIEELDVFALDRTIDTHFKMQKCDTLQKLRSKFGNKSPNKINFDNNNDLLISYWDFLPILPKSVSIESMKGLTLQENIKSLVDNVLKQNKISKDVYGLHFRGSDFVDHKGVTSKSLLQYMKKIDEALSINREQKFLFISDSEVAEKHLKKKFSDNIITIDKKSYPKKINEDQCWWDKGEGIMNIMRDEQSIIDSVIDLYTFASTTPLLADVRSTFALTAIELAQGERK